MYKSLKEIRARMTPNSAKTLHPVESRYGKISQESFNLLSSDRSSSKKNAALFSAFNSSLSLKFEWRQTSRREHQSQTVTDCLQMSLLQLELEPTIWHAAHFFSSLMCLLRGKQKNMRPKTRCVAFQTESSPLLPN